MNRLKDPRLWEPADPPPLLEDPYDYLEDICRRPPEPPAEPKTNDLRNVLVVLAVIVTLAVAVYLIASGH